MARHRESSNDKESEFIKIEGSERESEIQKTVEEALKKDPTEKYNELPTTPSEDKKFEPKVTEEEKPNFFKRAIGVVQELNQWDILFNSFFGIFWGVGAWLGRLISNETFEGTSHWILVVTFFMSGILMIVSKVLKRWEKKQQTKQESLKQELKQDQEIHEQELEFKQEVFANDQEIKLRRARLQEEIDRNQNVEVMAHFVDIIKQKPPTNEEIPLYVEQLQVASKVLDTLILDRTLRYGQFEEYQSNVLVKELQELTNVLNTMIGILGQGIETSGTQPFQYKHDYYQDKMLHSLNKIERLEMITESQKNLAQFHTKHPEHGLIKVCNTDKILYINDLQAKYTGLGIYQWEGKNIFDFIESEFPTDQRNLMLAKLQQVYLGQYIIVPVKNYITADGLMVDITLAIFPTFENLDVVGFDLLTIPYTEEGATEPPIELDTYEDCIDCNQILILLANPSDEEILKQESILKHMKYQTYRAQTISEAEVILSQEPIDMIVMDIYFEDGRALDFCIKLQTQYPFLKVIILATIVNETMEKNLKRLPNVFAVHRINHSPIDFMKSLQKATIQVLNERTELEREKGKILNGNISDMIPKPSSVEEKSEKIGDNKKKVGVNLDRG